MAKGKLRRFVVVFDQLTVVKGTAGNKMLVANYGEGHERKKKLATRKAHGPVEAYRLATGWKGRVSAGKGYSPQIPARSVSAYVPLPDTTKRNWKSKYRVATKGMPPHAYVIPLAEW